ncbi:MAG: YdcF family protein [Proteobacteria bacterium]|nr:YdcF family protein [Pseudomonadota bacterium]
MLTGALSRYLLDPVGIAILILVGAVIAEHYKRHRLARGLVIGTLAFLTAFAVLPVDDMLARPLESRYPRPALPARVDGIVVLNSNLGPAITASRGVIPEKGGLVRMLAGAELARRYPRARVVFSGIVQREEPLRGVEIASVRDFFRAEGIAPDRIVIEDRSVDTGTNLRFTKALVKPKPGEHWVLVTSAMHLPRAMAVTRNLSWTMIPWASDYETTAGWHLRSLKAPSDGLMTVDHALHEWIGRLIYVLTGRA